MNPMLETFNTLLAERPGEPFKLKGSQLALTVFFSDTAYMIDSDGELSEDNRWESGVRVTLDQTDRELPEDPTEARAELTRKITPRSLAAAAVENAIEAVEEALTAATPELLEEIAEENRKEREAAVEDDWDEIEKKLNEGFSFAVKAHPLEPFGTTKQEVRN